MSLSIKPKWRHSLGRLLLKSFCSVSQAVGVRIGVSLQALSTIVAAITIGLVFVWELTLVMLIFVPIIITAGKMQSRVMKGYSVKDKEGVEEGGRVR